MIYDYETVRIPSVDNYIYQDSKGNKININTSPVSKNNKFEFESMIQKELRIINDFIKQDKDYSGGKILNYVFVSDNKELGEKIFVDSYATLCVDKDSPNKTSEIMGLNKNV